MRDEWVFDSDLDALSSTLKTFRSTLSECFRTLEAAAQEEASAMQEGTGAPKQPSPT